MSPNGRNSSRGCSQKGIDFGQDKGKRCNNEVIFNGIGCRKDCYKGVLPMCENQQIDLPTMGRSIGPIWADNKLWISENTSSENTLPPPNLLLQQIWFAKKEEEEEDDKFLVKFNLN